MSIVHKVEFERIKREHAEVIALLTLLAKKRQKANAGKKGQLAGVPSFDPDIIETAVANANDAYALLLIAKSEAFMRTYLDSLNVPLGAEPKLSLLIDRCRREFNKQNPKIPIRTDAAQEVHYLREQRNAYAHGYSSNVFPPIARIVNILGRFFDQLP